MAFGKKKDPEEPKAPKEKKPKKEKPAKKEKPPKKGKDPKKPKKGQESPQEGEEQEEEGKKRPPIILLLIPIAVIIIAAVVFFLVIWPQLRDSPEDPEDPDVVESEEPKPPELPEKLVVGEVSVPGLTLEADESEAKAAVVAKAVTYTYTDLNDAGAAAKTYVDQLKAASPAFSVVDEDLVRTSKLPDFNAAEGTVLLARNLIKDEIKAEFGIKEVETTPAPTDPPADESGEPEGSAPVATPAPTATPEPVEEPPSYVITVRITWSEGKCVVVAGEEEGEVTSPSNPPGSTTSVGIRQAVAQLLSMTPAELGLPGTSMSEYEVIPENWTEVVNGVNCIRLDVFISRDSSNNLSPRVGSYLMSVDGQHLYKLDPITNEIQELKFTLNIG